MEYFSASGLILIIPGCIIAFFIGRLTSKERKDKKRLEMELQESREELKNYRSEVTSHFQETAHKFNALTENYRNIYEHLARGAQSLCDKSDAPELMNELIRNPMLGGETVEKPIVDHEAASTRAGTDNSSDPEPEEKTADQKPDNTVDTTAFGDQTKANGGEAEQSSDTIEASGGNENTGESTDAKGPIIAANERIKQEQQTPG